nr:unnamed protein product [Spirometra erinaceieuropaei]
MASIATDAIDFTLVAEAQRSDVELPNTATRTLLYAFKMSPFQLALAPSHVIFLPDMNVVLSLQLYDDKCSTPFTIYPTLESGRQ